MEIRNNLKKLDQYLKVVVDLNTTILEEGTLAPEELQIMRKYLLNCIDKIDDIQQSLQLPTTPTNMPVQELLQNNEMDTTQDNIAPAMELSEIINPAEEETSLLAPLEESEAIIQQSYTILQADLPTVKIPTLQNISTYTSVRQEPMVLVEEHNSIDNQFSQNTEQVLVATTKDEPINFFINEEQNNTTLVAKNETIDNERQVEPTKLVVEEEHKKEDIIDFSIQKEEPTLPISEINTRQEELISLVAKDEEKEELFVDFAKQQITPQKTELIQEEQQEQIPQLVAEEEEQIEDTVPLSSVINKINEYETIVNRKSLSESIALNDKFVFVRELFGSQFFVYEDVMNKLNEFTTLESAKEFCIKELSDTYKWNDKENIKDRFLAVLQKHFTQ